MRENSYSCLKQFYLYFLISAFGFLLFAWTGFVSCAQEGETAACLKFSKTTVTLVKGTSCTLPVEQSGITAKLKWKSSKTSVARVSSSGKVTARKAGTAEITVRANGYKAVCKVKVVAAQLNKKTLKLEAGDAGKLKVSGTSQTVRWKSSNPLVAKVSKKGKVTAIAAGTATVTATIGSSKLKCKVKVTEDKWASLLNQYLEDGETGQLVFVKCTGGSNATVEMYKKKNGAWKQVVSCKGYIGQNGLGKTKEGDRKTPSGVYNLTGAFGIKADPGAKMSYVQVNRYLYWCGDSSYYNQLVDIREKPHSCFGEHLIDYVPEYNYGMFLDYNADCVYGKGSAIFLHCTGSNAYTGGCIAVGQKNMIKIIKNAAAGAKICIYAD